MNVFAIEYTYRPDSEAIQQIRPRHREFLRELLDSGNLIGSGPYTDGDGGALILIRLPEPASLSDAEELMNQDPFYVEGALEARTFHTWNPVLNVFKEPQSAR